MIKTNITDEAAERLARNTQNSWRKKTRVATDNGGLGHTLTIELLEKHDDQDVFDLGIHAFLQVSSFKL